MAARRMPPVVERFFSLYRHRGDKSVTRHVIDVSLDMIHREVHNEHRFEQVSVVVVDYDMPEIDGLEFCRNLKNKAIKKILLTGKADEQTAVRAFNEKTIDRFIRKQDDDVMARLNRAIAELQREHFDQIEHMLADALRSDRTCSCATRLRRALRRDPPRSGHRRALPVLRAGRHPDAGHAAAPLTC
jgi:CheY-like chemotaxis protein